MKSKPHTIRFEESDFEFICKREKVKTAQEIINFLMTEYIKLYKVEKKSIFESNTNGTDAVNNCALTSPVKPEDYLIKDYHYYERKASEVEYDYAEELIKEIMNSSEIVSWKKNILKDFINKRFE